MLAFIWVLAFIGIMIYVTLNSSSIKYFNAGFSTTICPEFYLLNILVDLYGLCNADRTLKICAVTIITRVREIRLRKNFAMSCVFVNILYIIYKQYRQVSFSPVLSPCLFWALQEWCDFKVKATQAGCFYSLIYARISLRELDTISYENFIFDFYV